MFEVLLRLLLASDVDGKCQADDLVGSVKNVAVRSARWALFARAFQVLGLATAMVVLPFWLNPVDFGIITITASILALAIVLQQPGLVEVTIQDEDDPEAVRDVAFWTNLVVGAIVYLIVFGSAPLLATLFRLPELVWPLRVAGIQILLAGGSNVLLAWMERRFLYRKFSLIQFVASAATILVSVESGIGGSSVLGVHRCSAGWRPSPLGPGNPLHGLEATLSGRPRALDPGVAIWLLRAC